MRKYVRSRKGGSVVFCAEAFLRQASWLCAPHQGSPDNPQCWKRDAHPVIIGSNHLDFLWIHDRIGLCRVFILGEVKRHKETCVDIDISNIKEMVGLYEKRFNNDTESDSILALRN